MKYCTLALALLAAGATQAVFAESPPSLKVPESLKVTQHGESLETVHAEFGLVDGPAWDGAGSLFAPDVKGGKLYRYSPRNKKMLVVLPEAGRISATYFSHGRLYLSDNPGGRITRLEGKQQKLVAQLNVKSKPAERPNDLVVDNQGGMYVTLTGPGKVVYIPAGGKAVKVIKDINTPNGIVLSPGQKTLYVSSYAPKKVWAYDVAADGSVSGAREFAAMDDGPAKGADGMTIDRAGNVYCAGATDIWVWSPSGQLLEKIACPTRPINCAFGDNDMRSLYITGFGGLYRQRMRIAGCLPQLPAETDYPANIKKRPTTVAPKGVTALLDVEYSRVGDRRLLADIFLPAGSAKPGNPAAPAIVVVHGGGWLKGDKQKFRAMALALTARGYVTAAIEYRLGGEAKFPAAIHDCNAAVSYLRSNSQKYGIDSKRIGAVGGSAGGHLVGLMAAGSEVKALRAPGARSGSSNIQAAIVMAGPMQVSTGAVAERAQQNPQKSNAFHWIGKTLEDAPESYKLASPFQHLSKATPPILFMVGEKDQPSRNQPARDKLKSLGVETGLKVYEGGAHGCWNQTPYLQKMTADMDDFFKQHLK